MIAKDKQYHFAAGILIAFIVSLFYDGQQAFIISTILAVIIGGAKEFYDSKHRDKHTAEVMDAVYTAAGGVAGALAIELFKAVFIRS